MEAPLANHGDNTSAADRHHAAIGACPGGGSRELGLGGSDQAWSFESTADGVHRVVVTPEGDFDPALYVVSDCNDLAGSCLGGVDTVGVGPEELEVELAVGDEIRIIVDGCCIEEPGFGAYKLEVHRPCQPDCSQKECGDDGCGGVCDTCPVGKRCSDTFTCEDTAPGETCASPFVAAIPWTSTSSTAAASDDHEAAAGACPGVGWPMGDGAPDHVYRVKANATDLHTFTLEPEPGFDGALYVLDACGEQSTCLGGADLNGDGEKERLSLSLEAGDEVLVVVDGGSGEEIEAGGYTLRLSVGLP